MIVDFSYNAQKYDISFDFSLLQSTKLVLKAMIQLRTSRSTRRDRERDRNWNTPTVFVPVIEYRWTNGTSEQLRPFISTKVIFVANKPEPNEMCVWLKFVRFNYDCWYWFLCYALSLSINKYEWLFYLVVVVPFVLCPQLKNNNNYESRPFSGCQRQWYYGDVKHVCFFLLLLQNHR